jgi:diguanylate cyclase (GGDEF)-like protein
VGLALVAGWAGRAGDPPAWQLAAVVAGFAGTAMWVRSGRRSERVETVGPWLILAVAGLAIMATGGARSPYLALPLLVVLYAAAFAPTGRFLLLLAATMAVRATVAVQAGDARAWANAAIALLAWCSASVFVHGLVRRLDNAAQTDGLTGLWNHAAFWRRLQAEDARARRNTSSYTVLMLDVDHFKKLNDTYGHQTGDAVLRRMAEILGNRVRGSDVLARYGGEEFAVLLPDTAQAQGADVAEKLRRLLAVAGISVSIGVADNADDTARPDEVVGAADAALYEAKLAGRARVRSAPPPGTTALRPTADGGRGPRLAR